MAGARVHGVDVCTARGVGIVARVIGTPGGDSQQAGEKCGGVKHADFVHGVPRQDLNKKVEVTELVR
jgi:hypothetical protein